MVFVVYISGHGLGHASRSLELMHAIEAIQPDARFVVRTTAPPWVFDHPLSTPLDVQSCEVDTGIVQVDSLAIDEHATVESAAAFYSSFEVRVDEEARLLASVGAAIVIGDIPPLAFAAAARAGIKSMAIGNFTWDWIYGIYPGFARDAPTVIPTIAAANAQATGALRLPLHAGFGSMPSIVDIPFIARRSTRDPLAVRRALGVVDDGRPVVLVSFGRYGVDLSAASLPSSRFSVLPTPGDLPDGLRYVDLVAAADVVISKPGYGIVSDCLANTTALLYTSRGHFREYDLFVAEMPHLLRCRYIGGDDLRAGHWADAIDALLAQPDIAHRPRLDGAQVAAERIAATLG